MFSGASGTLLAARATTHLRGNAVEHMFAMQPTPLGSGERLHDGGRTTLSYRRRQREVSVALH